MIHCELCQKLQSDHTTKLYVHKPESVRENETQKILWDFEIQTDHLRRPNVLLINKRKLTYSLVDFAVSADHRAKIKESEMINKYMDLSRESKNLWNIWEMVIPNTVGALGTVSEGSERGPEG